jgi:hypothetical protein
LILPSELKFPGKPRRIAFYRVNLLSVGEIGVSKEASVFLVFLLAAES